MFSSHTIAFSSPMQRGASTVDRANLDRQGLDRSDDAAEADSLAPARGIALGLGLSMICWVVIVVGMVRWLSL